MSPTIKGLPLAVAIIEFTGSTLSFIGASFIIICYLLLPMKRHFRHALILNLAVADAANGLCDTLSGLQILIHRVDLKPSLGCTINGFIGQLTVQATDVSIFAITCVTVYIITRRKPIQSQWSRPAIISTCVAIWTLPVTTSFTALGQNWYGPVSGNWCWLKATPAYMRYVLTHGWRFLFIFLEIGLYSYLHITLKRHFRKTSRALSDTETGPSYSSSTRSQTIIDTNHNDKHEPSNIELKGSSWDDDKTSQVSSSHKPHDVGAISTLSSEASADTNNFKAPRHIMAHRTDDAGQARDSRLKAIEKVLLLNAYPLLYIILWIPGLANRLVEASGHTSEVTQVLQCSTQFVGLANALTFGWNEEVARQLKQRFGKKRVIS